MTAPLRTPWCGWATCPTGTWPGLRCRTTGRTSTGYQAPRWAWCTWASCVPVRSGTLSGLWPGRTPCWVPSQMIGTPMSDVESLWMSIPVSEFENLGEQIRVRGERITQLEEQLTAYVHMAQQLAGEVRELKRTIAGYEWGMSNAAA